MAFCEYCGSPINAGIRFCPNCGAPVAAQSAAPTSPVNTSFVTSNPFTFSGTVPAADFDVILIDTGACPPSVCGDLLEDMLGYSNYESAKLIAAAPVKVARHMGRRQARVVAQALAEYGARVAVLDQNGAYVDVLKETTSSVYNSRTGAFLASTVAVLATLSTENRVSEYTTFRRPGLSDYLFRLLFTPAPPVHVRRPRPAARPQPAARPVTRPTPSAAQPRPSAQLRPGSANPRPATAQPRPTAAKPAAQSRPGAQPVQRPASRPGNAPGSRPVSPKQSTRRPKTP